METERFFSGYCRCLDSSRMVEVLYSNKTILECDCGYGSCIYQSNCPIAKEIEKEIEA